MSSKTRTIILAAAVALTLGAGVAANARDGKPREPVSVADLTVKSQQTAAAMDGNGDGFVTGEESLAYRDAQRLARAERRLLRFDANGDGKVSVAEISDARTARLAKLDANGDGKVEASEWRAMRHHRGHRGGFDGR